MDIYYVKRKLEKKCNSEKEATKEWGPVVAKKLMQRFSELAALDNLSMASHLPPLRLHQLSGKRNEQFGVDVVRNSFRIVFIPANKPLPRLDDGGIDKSKVTEIMILEVTNYHVE